MVQGRRQRGRLRTALRVVGLFCVLVGMIMTFLAVREYVELRDLTYIVPALYTWRYAGPALMLLGLSPYLAGRRSMTSDTTAT